MNKIKIISTQLLALLIIEMTTTYLMNKYMKMEKKNDMCSYRQRRLPTLYFHKNEKIYFKMLKSH